MTAAKRGRKRVRGEHTKKLGKRLKERIFETIFPQLAQGFLHDHNRRLGIERQPTADELRDIYEAAVVLLYRLLFLLYAESRDLLPIREASYRAVSLTKITQEIAEKAGVAAAEAGERLAKAYAAGDTALYDRLQRICAAIDRGDATLNVPIYNGGLFITRPDKSDTREQRIARFLAEHKLSDRCLAPAIDGLARDPHGKTVSLSFIDYKSLEVRHLGSIYENLLEFKLCVADEDLTTTAKKGNDKFVPLSAVLPKRGKSARVVVKKGAIYLSNDKAERKASGSYYTPDAIVEYIVEQTIGPVLAEHLEALRGELSKVSITSRDVAARSTNILHRDLVDQLFDFRILDPAMGSGHFLVAAVEFIADRLLTFLNQFAVNPASFMLDETRSNLLEALGEQAISIDPHMLTDANLLKRRVLARCIYGVDLNPMAVELAKMSLWLDAGPIGMPLSFLNDHLRCGNSLIGATIESFAGFDAVVSNPPYAGHKGDYDAALLKDLYEVCRSNPNPATAFLERGLMLLRNNGRLGMIVPKSIQYVESWQPSRQLLAESHNLIGIADVSQAFDDVLLEQTVCLAAKQPTVDGYEAHTFESNGKFSGKRIERAIAESLGCFPARVDERSLELLRRILQAGPRLGEISTTSQALGYQAHLNKDITGRHLPIHRGKQIRPMRIDAPEDYIDRSYLTRTSSNDLTSKVSEMLHPKVVSQNIVAHVSRPKPRVWIISAPDRDGILCLNTISTTIMHDDRYTVEFIAAILNSTLASWFFTEFVFCRAIRTMHFDNYYAGKLPIAKTSPSLRRSFDRLPQQIQACDSRGMRQRAIDNAVFDAYGLSNDERQFLYAYCYGTDQIETVLSGF